MSHGSNRPERATLSQALIDEHRAAPRKFDESGENVALIFTDLVGSTAYKYGRNELEGIAKPYAHNRIADEIIRGPSFSGTTVKLLGDGLMAYFDGGDCCKRALACAIRIIESFKEHNATIPNWKDHIITHIGIHCGRVWFFPFAQHTSLDPLGATVDLTSRLCPIAPDMNIVITESAFQSAGGESEFPHRMGPQSRHLKGIPDPLNLFTVAAAASEVKPIALSWSIRPNDTNVQQHLDHAKACIENGDYTRAKNSFADAIKPDLDPRNFDANVGLAEMLALYDANGGLGTDARLKLAYERLCAVKTDRPSSYIWMLLAWVQFRRYLKAAANRQEAINFLNDAVKFAEQARQIADGYRESHGSVCSRVYLTVYLSERVRRLKTGGAADDLQWATRYHAEAQQIRDKGLGNRVDSNFITGQAMIQLANGGNVSEAKRLLRNALDADETNPVASEILNQLNNP